MKSPFPGMDPYIESCGLWEDFHHDLIGDIKTTLNQILPEKYTARACERAYISLASDEGAGMKRYRIQGDVTVVRTSDIPAPAAATALVESPAVTTEIEPIEMMSVIQSEFREQFIEIREAVPDRPLVTTIEILSPSNKRRGTDGWDLYERKRRSHLHGAANLVEIDLLRGGQRMPMISEWPDSPYTILVSRKSRAPYCSAWKASFASPLPTIPIPLETADPDVMIALQPMIDAIYARSRYSNDIDYRQPCSPVFTSAEEKWFRERMAQLAADTR